MKSQTGMSSFRLSCEPTLRNSILLGKYDYEQTRNHVFFKAGDVFLNALRKTFNLHRTEKSRDKITKFVSYILYTLKTTF